MQDRYFYLKLLAVIFVAITAMLAFEITWELHDAVDSAGKPITWATFTVTPSMVRAVSSPCARAFNNQIALLLTFIALAIPITANNYTPRLIDIFLKDRVNLTMLVSFAVLAGHSIFASAFSFDTFAGVLPLWITAAAATLGWLVLIPYYFYVLRFLDPELIVERVSAALLAEVDAFARGTQPAVAQRRLSARIVHLGSIILKSIDRADRDTAIDATRSLVRVMTRYREVKPRVDPRLLEVSGDQFTGLASSAIAILNNDRIWVEQKCLTQLSLGFSAALAKVPDAVSAISNAVKDVAVQHTAPAEQPVLGLHVRFLNTFLRESIKKKDVHAIYDVLYQYKSLARRLMVATPDSIPEIARYLRYYAEFSLAQGMPFIYEVSSYELAELCERATEAKVATASALLDEFLALDAMKESVRVVKSRALLGSYLLERGPSEALERVRAALGQAAPALLVRARDGIVGTTDPVFWEITDRQSNLDFVPAERRARVRELLDGILAQPSAERMPAGRRA